MVCAVQHPNKPQENTELIHMKVQLGKSRSDCPLSTFSQAVTGNKNLFWIEPTGKMKVK